MNDERDTRANILDEWNNAWQIGGRPRLDAFLAQVPEVHRPRLFADLLRAELEWRYRLGESPTEADYSVFGPIPAEWFDDARVAALPADETPPTESRFTVVRFHAQGGLGRVSLARDAQLDRDVALKEIRADRSRSSGARQRFINEAKITGKLEHPGIVPVYALEDADPPRYAMRFVAGRTLADAISAYHAAPSPLAFADLLRRFVSVCQTIAFAHSKGVIHRDLKPANVMLGDYGETLVIDWGLAKEIGPPVPFAESGVTSLPQLGGLTAYGQIVGTPAYMAPEQAAGDPNAVREPADVFALGAMLYDILTDHAPYDADAFVLLIGKVLEANAPPPRQINPRVPVALDAVCRKAMKREPKDRYPNALELAAEVERFLADEPVRCVREPFGTRARRWAKRHRTLVSAFAGSLVVGATLLAVGLVLVSAAERRAEGQAKIASERFGEALAAIQDIVTSAQQTLADNPKSASARRNLLATAQTRLLALLPGDAESPSVDPVRFQIHAGLGDVAFLLGDAPTARTEFHNALAIDREGAVSPADRAKVNLRLARLHMNVNALDEARKNVEQSIALVGRDDETTGVMLEIALQAGDLAKAIEVVGGAGGPVVKAEDRERLAERLVERGDRAKTFAEKQAMLEQAHKLARSLAEEDPTRLMAWRIATATRNHLGVALKNRDNAPAAKAAFGEAYAVAELATRHHPNDHRLIEGLGSNASHLAELLADEGDREQAIRLYNLAVEAARRALAVEPRSLEARHQLTESLRGLADELLATGDSPGHLRVLEEAARESEATPVDSQRFRYLQATIYQRLAKTAKGQGDGEVSLKWALRAKAITDRLPTDDSENRFVRSISWEAEADAHRVKGDLDSARRCYVEAAEHARAAATMAEKVPGQLHVHRGPLYALEVLAVIESNNGNYAEAIPRWADLVAYTEGLIARGFGRPEDDKFLAEYRKNLELCRMALRATDDLDYALGLPDHQRLFALNGRCEVLMRRGDWASVADTAERWASPDGLQTRTSYYAATFFARMAEKLRTGDPLREKYAARAVELLRQESRIGGLGVDTPYGELWEGSVFRVLYDRPDWQAFLWEVAEVPPKR